MITRKVALLIFLIPFSKIYYKQKYALPYFLENYTRHPRCEADSSLEGADPGMNPEIIFDLTTYVVTLTFHRIKNSSVLKQFESNHYVLKNGDVMLAIKLLVVTNYEKLNLQRSKSITSTAVNSSKELRQFSMKDRHELRIAVNQYFNKTDKNVTSYGSNFCYLNLDMKLEDLPEDLPEDELSKKKIIFLALFAILFFITIITCAVQIYKINNPNAVGP